MNTFILDWELSQKMYESAGMIAAVSSCTIRDKRIKEENHTWGDAMHVFGDHALSVQPAEQSKYSFHMLHSISLSLYLSHT